MSRHYSFPDRNEHIPKQKHLGSARYHLKGEQQYRTIENVTNEQNARSEIHKLFPAAKIDFVSDIHYYEDTADVYRRKYYKNILRYGDKNKLTNGQ